MRDTQNPKHRNSHKNGSRKSELTKSPERETGSCSEGTGLPRKVAPWQQSYQSRAIKDYQPDEKTSPHLRRLHIVKTRNTRTVLKGL